MRVIPDHKIGAGGFQLFRAVCLCGNRHTFFFVAPMNVYGYEICGLLDLTYSFV